MDVLDHVELLEHLTRASAQCHVAAHRAKLYDDDDLPAIREYVTEAKQHLADAEKLLNDKFPVV